MAQAEWKVESLGKWHKYHNEWSATVHRVRVTMSTIVEIDDSDVLGSDRPDILMAKKVQTATVHALLTEGARVVRCGVHELAREAENCAENRD